MLSSGDFNILDHFPVSAYCYTTVGKIDNFAMLSGIGRLTGTGGNVSLCVSSRQLASGVREGHCPAVIK